MEDCCAVCAEPLEWVAYGSCGHREVCSTCVVRLRFVLQDQKCCICKTESPSVFVTKALGDYTRVISDFSTLPSGAHEGQAGSFWYHEGSQAFFDDVDHYRMIKAMCRLSCSVCDKNSEEQGGEGARRRQRFRSIEQLKGHLFHNHKLHMCSVCLEGRKVFICEQKLYTRAQLNQHIRSGDSEADGSESERGGFTGHPMCEFCGNPFYGDNELYMHMSTEHYTCHICQRQHPGQYDYFRNYDDLETHFRQEHFLCEDEACLAKKFIVFQSESEMKRHNAIEHGGNMSRSKRNAALQIPTSFRYRSNQDHRRGRGRGFRPDPSNDHLSRAIQASLDTAIADGRAHDSSSSNQPVTSSGETRQSVPSSQESSSSHILEESYFPPLSDRGPPETSTRYVQAFSQRNIAKFKEELFPPLPGAKVSTKPINGVDLSGNSSSSSSTLASRLGKEKGKIKVINAPRPREPHDPTSDSSSFPQLKPIIQNQAPTTSTSNLKPNTNRTSVSSGNRMRHSSSAPNLVNTSTEPPMVAPNLKIVEDVQTANKVLVEKIRIGLGNDEEKFAAFKTISAEYRLGQINAWEYLSYIEQFGLMHLVFELGTLCPDTQKQKELFDAYNAKIRSQNLQENGNIKHQKMKGKGKGIVIDGNKKNEMADDFLDKVKKLQLNQKQRGEEVEVLSKDGYRTSKSISNSNSNLISGGESSKKGRKIPKFDRMRLGDGAAAAPLDVEDRNPSPERAKEENDNNLTPGLPVKGVWKNNGGRKIF